MPLQPVTFQDFHGGMADKYIGTDINRAELVQNLLIDETKKPYCRYGTSIYATRASAIADNTTPTGLYIGSEPFSHPVEIVGAHAYVMNESSNWTEIIGTNTSFLPTKTDQTRESALIWRRQIIAAAPIDSLPPAMIYCTNYVEPAASGNPATYKALTLGLPALATAPTVHYDATDAYQTVYAFYYKYTFIDYQGTLFAFFGNPTGVALLPASGSGDPSGSSISLSNIAALANTSLTNYDVSSSTDHTTSFVAGSTTVTVGSTADLAPGYQVFFTSGSTNYVPQGTVITEILSGTSIRVSNPATATAAGLSTVRFATLTIQIYRTINGGTVFFYAGQVANGTTTYTDSLSDANLQLNQTIYTSGNALGYDQPPLAAIAVTQVNDFFWFATTTTLYQSIQGAPGACPSSTSDQIDQKIIGLSDIQSFPILFCDKSVYRVEGTFDSFGNGGFSLREISKTAGCIGNSSIVKTPYGLFWFGNGGIFFTDGYKVTKVSRHLNTSYETWANVNSCATFDPIGNMVHWTINTTPGTGTTNTAWLVLHLNFGFSEEMTFTTQASQGNIYPSTLAFSSSIDIINSGGTFAPLYNRVLTSEINGFLLWFDPNSLTDVKINTLLFPSQMTKETIRWHWITAGLDQGISGFRKYNPDCSLELDASTGVAAQIRHRRDDGAGWSGEGGSPPSGRGVAGSPGGGSSGNPGSPEIRQDGSIIWNLSDCSWLDDPNEFQWNSIPSISGKRSVPAGILRASRRQLWFTNSYTIISASSQLSTATITLGGSGFYPSLTLDDNTLLWISDPEGYWITLAADGYNQTYLIVSRDSDTKISVLDPYNTLTAISTAWEIKGFRKFERPRILNYTLYAEVEGSTYGQSTLPVGGN